MRLYNVFQFLKLSFALTHSGITNNEYETIEYEAKASPGADFGKWDIIHNEVLPEAKELIKLLSSTNIPIPEVGFEIDSENGMIIAQCELAWVELRIGVMLGDVNVVEGWQIFSVENSDMLIQCIKQRG